MLVKDAWLSEGDERNEIAGLNRFRHDVVAFAIGAADTVEGDMHSWTCGCRASAEGDDLTIVPCAEHVGEFDEEP
jgi:hypothetical protein